MALFYTWYEAPCDRLLLAGTEDSLHYVSFASGVNPRQPDADWVHSTTAFDAVIAQLDAYFRSELTVFDLPLTLEGTAFQQSVWRALLQIPFGETRTYGDIANMIDNPKSVRAVGVANGANPIPVIIPCHRVIGADGSLTGFGGGMENKRWLLRHEGLLQPTEQPSLPF